MAVNVSAGHLAPSGGGFEPQRVFNWVLVLPGVNDPELIRLSVEKMSAPSLGSAVIHLRYMNEDRKVAGGFSVDANTISVRDFVDKQTFKTLNDWFEQVHDPATGEIGYASDYKKQATIQLVDPKGEVKRSITARGVWPSKLTASDFDYNNDTANVKIALTLQVDSYLMNL